MGLFPESLKDTIVVFILKVESPIALEDIQPISLCNILYKIMVKALANRLIDVLHDLIAPIQSAFCTW